MERYTIRQGDTGRVIRAQLEDDNGVVDLSADGSWGEATSAVFRFRKRGGEDVVEGAATIENEDTGIVAYEFGPNETDEVGYYLGEFEVTFTSGKTVSFPSDTYIDLYITEALD